MKRLGGFDKNEAIDDVTELVKPDFQQIKFIIKSETVINHGRLPPKTRSYSCVSKFMHQQ